MWRLALEAPVCFGGPVQLSRGDGKEGIGRGRGGEVEGRRGRKGGRIGRRWDGRRRGSSCAFLLTCWI